MLALETVDHHAQYWRYHPGGRESEQHCDTLIGNTDCKENKTKKGLPGRGDDTATAPSRARSFFKMQRGSMIAQMLVISDKLNETLLKSFRHHSRGTVQSTIAPSDFEHIARSASLWMQYLTRAKLT